MRKLLLCMFLGVLACTVGVLKADTKTFAPFAYNMRNDLIAKHKHKSSSSKSLEANCKCKVHTKCKPDCAPKCSSANCTTTFMIPIVSSAIPVGESVIISLTTPQGTVLSQTVTSTSPSPVTFTIPAPTCCGLYTITVTDISIPTIPASTLFPPTGPIATVTNSCNLTSALTIPAFPFSDTTLTSGSSIQALVNLTAPFLPCTACKCKTKCKTKCDVTDSSN